MGVAFEQFEHVAKLAPVSIQIFNAAGQSVFANDKFVEVFGEPPANYSILQDDEMSATGLLPLIKQAFAGNDTTLPATWQTIQTNEKKKRLAIETKMVPIRVNHDIVSHVVFMYSDVTAQMLLREESQRALKERDDALSLVQTVFDETQAVVYLKSLEGRFIFVNGQFCRIFNKSPDQIIGKSDYELFPKEIADTFRNNDLHVIRTGKHSESEEVALHFDGTSHNYLSLKFPIHDSKGEIVGAGGISTDITQYRRMEQELSAAKRMESIGLLAGGIAHDFNNTLGIIMLVADTLLMTGGDQKPQWKESIETLKKSAQSAALLTRRLMAFGKKQTARASIVDLKQLTQNTWSILKNAMSEDIKTTLVMDPELWPVFADASQIEQIITNLCFNAKEAMPQGGELKITLKNSATPAPAEWQLKQPVAASVELTVTDTGHGMDSKIMERIFEPFFTTKAEGVGSGLGLATVYGLLKAIGGNIAVQSAVGRGTTFRVVFPKHETSIHPITSNPQIEKSALVGNETVLLVEDQDDLRMVTASILREFGYTVFEASNARTGIDLWVQKKTQIDIVLADVVMPNMSGYEMVQEITRLQDGRPLRALLVSAYAEKKLADYNNQKEVVHFLEKPYSSTQLLLKLRQAIKGAP